METFATLGDMLLRRYIVDYIAQMQQLSAPIYSRLKENSRFIPSGDGAFFAIRVDGNESGAGWRATDDNQLPTAGNEHIKQARVRPKKYYRVVTFSGLAEAVSRRGGQDAFAAGVTDAISTSVTRAGRDFEVNFLRSDGTGKMTDVASGFSGPNTVVSVDDARPFIENMVVTFLNNTTGAKTAGPATVQSRDIENSTITLSSSVSPSAGDGIYRNSEQTGAAAPAEVTALGLPAIVANSGTIYNLSRTSFPILQSKVINASSASLDESLLRRIRKRLLVETAVGSVDNFVMISNYEQYDRYTEITLPFRRFPDMRLDLGANQELTTFEGRPWLISWAADPTIVYFLNLAAIERGVVRPLSIDERVNMAWLPGQDAFTVLMKYYGENVCRYINQTGKITTLSTPSF